MDDLHDHRFACAPGMRIEAHERLVALQFAQVAATLERIEAVMERLERRLWLAVYGVVAAIGAQAAQGIVGL
ncbi:GTA head formation protein, RCAP_rcc01685 family [Limimaricola sp.]|uniref:GTA head formation protein, RCAP_rcc01685 family n=1 Tax=Limimaricola sp. TaxID=2211665 RepID=UPI0040581181